MMPRQQKRMVENLGDFIRGRDFENIENRRSTLYDRTDNTGVRRYYARSSHANAYDARNYTRFRSAATTRHLGNHL